MQPDDTLIEVRPLLRNFGAYLMGVIEHMNECAAARGNAYLRLGITGSGQYPCYRVVYHPESSPDTEEVFGSYYDSHKPIAAPYDKIVPGKWSTRTMGLHEVLLLTSA